MGAIDDLRRFESDWHRATTARDKGIGSERAPEPLVKVESDGWKYTVRLNTDVPSSVRERFLTRAEECLYDLLLEVQAEELKRLKDAAVAEARTAFSA